jgi:endonuclease YncB( thermonuclease family)
VALLRLFLKVEASLVALAAAWQRLANLRANASANRLWHCPRMMKPAAFAVILSAGPALGQTVTDGDTIKLDGTTYRIWGIDAAEAKQACADGWMAGREATTALLELVKGRTLACEAKARDRYGRTVALCRADGVDVGAAMVSAGHGLGIHAVQLRLHRTRAGGDRRQPRRPCA